MCVASLQVMQPLCIAVIHSSFPLDENKAKTTNPPALTFPLNPTLDSVKVKLMLDPANQLAHNIV